MWSTFQPPWKMQCPIYFFQELDSFFFFFFYLSNWKNTWYLYCLNFYLEDLHFFAPPSDGLFQKVSAKRTPAHAQMTLCNKMDDSLEMGPPDMFGVVCFLNQIQFTKMYNWFKSCSLLITCWQSCKFCVWSTSIHFVCRWFFLKCLKESLPHVDSVLQTPHFA